MKAFRILSLLCFCVAWGYFALLIQPTILYRMIAYRHSIWLQDGPVGLESWVTSLSSGLKVTSHFVFSPLIELMDQFDPRILQTMGQALENPYMQSFLGFGYAILQRILRLLVLGIYAFPLIGLTILYDQSQKIGAQPTIQRRGTDLWALVWIVYQIYLWILPVLIVCPWVLCVDFWILSSGVQILAIHYFLHHKARG